MYHIFFIHSSLQEYLGCFQILSIKNNKKSAINIMGKILCGIVEQIFGIFPGES
jgi:drug/metabolite transporter superfamily protein YnfA